MVGFVPGSVIGAGVGAGVGKLVEIAEEKKVEKLN